MALGLGPLEKERYAERIHRYIMLRLGGWTLIGAWQLLSLLSEFSDIVDIERRDARIVGKILGIVGLFMVAYGFEKITELQHQMSGVHD